MLDKGIVVTIVLPDIACCLGSEIKFMPSSSKDFSRVYE